MHATEAVAAKLKDPQIVYVVETLSQASAEVPQPVVLRGKDLDFDTDLSNVKLLVEADQEDLNGLSCAHFCLKSKSAPPFFSAEVRNNIWHIILLMGVIERLFYRVTYLILLPVSSIMLAMSFYLF